MKKIFFAIVITCFSLVLGQNVQYINNALTKYSGDIHSGDARYIGMSGSMGALGGNISSTEQNPAGIGVNISSDLSLTLGVSSFNNEVNFGNTRETDDSQFNFNQIGGVIVFDGPNDKWKSFSLGFNFLYEDLDDITLTARNENVTFDLFDDDTGDLVQADAFTFNGYADEVNGYKQKLSISFASNYDDKIYLGASANFHYAEFENFVNYSETDETQGINTLYDQADTPYFEFGNGFSLGVGVIGKITQNLRLGAAYHSPVWYTVEEELIETDNLGFFTAFSDYDLTTAGRFVGSLGVVAGKKLALNFDYTYHMNEGLNLRPSGNFATTNDLIDGVIRNTSEFRAGAEFRHEGLRLRGGYNFVEGSYERISPGQQVIVNPSDPTQIIVDSTQTSVFVNGNNNVINTTVEDPYIGDITRWSAGIGYDFGNFYIDAAYQHHNQEFNYVFGNTAYIDVSNSANQIILSDTYVSEVERNSNLFLLTAGWQF